jgi:carbamoyl-phosphate synthase large subunit
VAVRDPNLLEITRRFVQETKWRGPCETEILRTEEGKYCLIEINPRFPAWTYLSAGAGQNLPYAVAQLAAGEALGPLPDFKAGTMFVRIAIDQIAQMSDFQQITQTGELKLGPLPAPAPLGGQPPNEPLAKAQAGSATSPGRSALVLN